MVSRKRKASSGTGSANNTSKKQKTSAIDNTNSTKVTSVHQPSGAVLPPVSEQLPSHFEDSNSSFVPGDTDVDMGDADTMGGPMSLDQLAMQTANTTAPSVQPELNSTPLLTATAGSSAIPAASKPWLTTPTGPSPVLSQDSPCPIDWTLTDLQSVKEYNKECFIMRSPWKPASDYTTDQVRDILNAKYSQDEEYRNEMKGKTNLTSESWRKRFMTTNFAVYKATGLWWARMWAGLKKLVPKPSTVSIAAARSVKVQEVEEVLDGESLDFDAESDLELNESGVNNQPKHWAGDSCRIYIQEPGSFEIEMRTVPVTAICQASATLADYLSCRRDYSFTIENVLPDTVDRFFSFFHPEKPVSIPEEGHKLVKDEWDAWIFHEFPTNLTAGDWMDIYVLAANLGSTDVCTMILNHWREMHLTEVNSREASATLRAEWNSGKRALNDIPFQPPASILHFEPSQLNRLWSWNCIEEDDAVMDFWLKMLVDCGSDAYTKIRYGLHEYCDGFLELWKDVLAIRGNTQELLELTKALKHSPVHHGFVPDDVRVIVCFDEDGWKSSADEGVNEDPTGTNGPSGDSPGKHSSGKSGSDKAGPRIYSPRQIVSNNQATDRDDRDESIPRENDGEEDSDWEDLEEDDFHVTRPPNHVKMVINRIPGFIIQNNTSLSKDEFRKLPRQFPNWHWEKVRAVNCYKVRTGQTDLRPSYFDDGFTGSNNSPMQDANGRWPSHPGYRDSEWNTAELIRDEDDLVVYYSSDDEVDDGDLQTLLEIQNRLESWERYSVRPPLSDLMDIAHNSLLKEYHGDSSGESDLDDQEERNLPKKLSRKSPKKRNRIPYNPHKHNDSDLDEEKNSNLNQGLEENSHSNQEVGIDLEVEEDRVGTATDDEEDEEDRVGTATDDGENEQDGEDEGNDGDDEDDGNDKFEELVLAAFRDEDEEEEDAWEDQADSDQDGIVDMEDEPDVAALVDSVLGADSDYKMEKKPVQTGVGAVPWVAFRKRKREDDNGDHEQGESEVGNRSKRARTDEIRFRGLTTFEENPHAERVSLGMACFVPGTCR